MLKQFIKNNFVNDSHPFIKSSYKTLSKGKTAAKNFIIEHLVNSKYPLIMDSYFKRKSQNFKAQQARNSSMTYAEIEAEISRSYEAMFHRKLDWANPQTYNEKMHVSKLYMPSPIKTQLADKYLVRNWVAEKIGQQYLIPLLGVYDNFDEIDFDALPEKFVIKCNHDSGSVTLVQDKSKLDMKLLKHKYDFYMMQNYAWRFWEMHYRDIKPKIIIEQYMGEAINDYKFHCFGGKVYYCCVDFNRQVNHKRNVYDMQWNLQPFNFNPSYLNNTKITCPENWDELKETAGILGADFDQVRVDLYIVDNKIYFGEMTFTDCGGWSDFVPVEADYQLGKLWPFDNSVRSGILASHSRP